MKVTRFLALALAISGSACGGASTAPGAAEPAAQDDILLPTGGCDEVAVDDAVKRIEPRGLPWSYLVVKDASVQCEDRRVIAQLGPGASVVLTSIGDDSSGTAAADFGPALVRAVATDFQRLDANAALSGERPTTLGRESLKGHCGRVDFTADGTPLVSHVCSAWRTTGDASHFVVVGITDTEENFASVDQTVDQLVGGLVDGFTLD